MPNIKSAEKRVEIAHKRTLRNAPIKSAVKTAVKKFETSLQTTPEEAENLFRKASSSLDKAVTKGVLHKKTAGRKKARLAKKLNEVKTS